jgi:hypothetical protein
LRVVGFFFVPGKSLRLRRLIVVVKYGWLLLVVLKLVLLVLAVFIVVVVGLAHEASKGFCVIRGNLISARWLPRGILKVHLCYGK